MACLVSTPREGRHLHETTASSGTRGRLTAVPVVAHHLLVPALPALLDAHPALEVELVAEPRDLSLTRREADVALHLARPTRELRTVARRVGRLAYGVYSLAGRREPSVPFVTFEDAMR